MTMPGESHFNDFIPFLQRSHARSFCECVYSSHETLSQEGQCKTQGVEPLRPGRRRSFGEGFRLTFSACKRRAAPMRLRWRPVRTQASSSRPPVPKVTPKAHFWGAWATLFEVTVPECCMSDKQIICHVLTTLGGSGLPVFITRPAFAT